MKQRILELERELIKKETKKQLLTETIKKKSEELEKKEKEAMSRLIARELLDKLSFLTREKGKQALEDAVSSVLQLVFGSAYSVKLELETKNGLPTAQLYLKKTVGLHEQYVAVENEGGGLKQVLSLAFFVAVSKLSSENNAALLTLDEPTSAISIGKQEDAAKAIITLTNYLQKQSIVITHDREYLPLLVENCFLVSQGADGVSKLTVL